MFQTASLSIPSTFSELLKKKVKISYEMLHKRGGHFLNVHVILVGKKHLEKTGKFCAYFVQPCSI